MQFNAIVDVLGADGVVVGINKNDYGHSCSENLICGEEIKICSIIAFVHDEMSIDGLKQFVIKVMIVDCHVGWVPRTDLNHFMNECNGRRGYSHRLPQ